MATAPSRLGFPLALADEPDQMRGMADAPYIGRFINLDRSPERRRRMEDQLARLGVADRYARFAAVDGAAEAPAAAMRPGELGCFLSHQRILVEHAGAGRALHIVEDDVVFGPRSFQVLDQVVAGALEHFDLLYLDISVLFNLILQLSIIKAYRITGAEGAGGLTSIGYLPLRGVVFMGTTSYVVSGRALGRLAEAVEAERRLGPTAPIDVLYQRWIAEGRFSAACTIPFLSTILPPDETPSTTDEPDADVEKVGYLTRAPFFIDRDDETLRRVLGRLGRPSSASTAAGTASV